MSVRNDILKFALRRFVQPQFVSAADIEKFRKSVAFNEHPSMFKGANVSYRVIAETKITVIEPQDIRSERLLIMLHGGAYVCGPSQFHVKAAAKLANDLGQTVYFVRYPLAPEAPYPHAFNSVIEAIRALANEHKSQALQLFGDSAGGGLALAVTMALKQDRLISQLALLSPWLDLTLSHAAFEEHTRREVVMNASFLHDAANAYASRYDKKAWQLSPAFGDLSGLPRTLLMCGTDDFNVGDCRDLYKRAQSAGGPVDYIEAKGQIHNWIMFQPIIPEARRDFTRLVQFLKHKY